MYAADLRKIYGLGRSTRLLGILNKDHPLFKRAAHQTHGKQQTAIQQRHAENPSLDGCERYECQIGQGSNEDSLVRRAFGQSAAKLEPEGRSIGGQVDATKESCDVRKLSETEQQKTCRKWTERKEGRLKMKGNELMKHSTNLPRGDSFLSSLPLPYAENLARR